MKPVISVPFLVILATAVLVVVATAGASRGVAPPVRSFKYCNNPTFPPMESKTPSGKPVGFDIDLARAIGTLWRVKAIFVGTSFPGLLPALGARKCNMVLSALIIRPDRTAKFPAVPYMRTHRALIVQAGNPKNIKSPSDLSGKKVAVQAETTYERYLKQLNAKFKAAGKPQMNLKRYPSDTGAVAQVLIGRADAMLTQDTEAAYQKRQHPGKLAIGYLFPATDAFGIYYRRADAKLGTALRSAIKAFKKNGTLRKLAAKYQIPVSNVR